jgi:hypothetical protein
VLTLFWKYAPLILLHCYWSFDSLLKTLWKFSHSSQELESKALMFHYPVSWEVVSFAWCEAMGWWDWHGQARGSS